jgi:hypothetical protein
MNSYTPRLMTSIAIAVLAVGTIGLTSVAFAAPPTAAVAATSADLLAKADHHAMMAANYRARATADSKHAVAWFTLANHCDQKAQAYRVAALGAGTEPTYRR